jgi:hypothetical protein
MAPANWSNSSKSSQATPKFFSFQKFFQLKLWLLLLTALASSARAVVVKSIWSPDGRVDCFAIFSGNLYIGGQFSHLVSPGGVSSVARNNLASLNLSTGVPTAWDPGADGETLSMVRQSNTLLVGGLFQNIAGQARSRLAQLDISSVSATATSWNPGADGAVQALLISGSVAYAGGSFSNAGGQPRQSLVALDASGGTGWALAAFNAALTPTASAVYSLTLQGSSLFVAGNFSSAGAQARNGLLALNPSSGAVLAWNPASSLSAGAFFYGLFNVGSLLYVSGEFSGNLGAQAVSRAMALDAGTGNLLWKPTAVPDAVVRSIATDGSGRVLLGGDFSQVCGQTRERFASLYASDGSPDPSLVADLNIPSTTLYAVGPAGTDIALAGNFNTVAGISSPNLALISPGVLPSFTPSPLPVAPLPSQPASLYVYPHPLRCPGGSVMLNLSSPGSIVIRILSLRGALVKKLSQHGAAGQNKLDLSCNDFDPGLYVLKGLVQFDQGGEENFEPYHFEVAPR